MYAVSHNFENGTRSCISVNVLLRMVHILLSITDKQVIRLFLFNHFIRSYFCLADWNKKVLSTLYASLPSADFKIVSTT